MRDICSFASSLSLRVFLCARTRTLVLLAIFVYPPDEEATLRAAAEANEAVVAEFVRREKSRKDLTQPETKTELERDTARAERIYAGLEGQGSQIANLRECGHPSQVVSLRRRPVFHACGNG